jgi:hypothetical protein
LRFGFLGVHFYFAKTIQRQTRKTHTKVQNKNG